jgi:hypothetical protein
MVTARSDVTVRNEFLAVVLADPELLDLAFAEVMASWEAEPPRPPNQTLVGTSEGKTLPPRIWGLDRDREDWHAWLRAIPRPTVARSPPEQSVAGRLRKRVDAETNPQQPPMESAKEVVASQTTESELQMQARLSR